MKKKDSIYQLESGEYVDLESIVSISKITSGGGGLKAFAWLEFDIHVQLSDKITITMTKYVTNEETNEEKMEDVRDRLVKAWKEFKIK